MKRFRYLTAFLLAAVTLGQISPPAPPTAGFTMAPGNPVVGQPVVFNDASTGNPTGWAWDFGDGTIPSGQRSPRHLYASTGPRDVKLTATNTDGSSSATRTIFVSAASTLRLYPSGSGTRAFDVTLVATDQRTGRVAAGQALPRNEGFGYFALPDFTGDPNNSEVCVKVLDGTAINGSVWVFYGHLTDLIYDLTVTEVATGLARRYHKDAGATPGGFDTSAFGAAPAPTPTPPAATVVNLVASDFRWDLDGGGQTITLHVGQTYELRIRRAPGTSHAFSGLERSTTFAISLGCGPANLVAPAVCRFTPTAADIGDYYYFCTNDLCGSGHSDAAMQNGILTIAP